MNKALLREQRKNRREFKRMLGEVLIEERSHIAYERGASCFARLCTGDIFISSYDEAIKAGYPHASKENRLFREGFLDAMQDARVTIHTDSENVIYEFSVPLGPTLELML